MGELAPVDWLIILAVLISIPWLCYRHGKKMGDQVGYIRGYKEGQQTVKGTLVLDGGTFSPQPKSSV